MDRGSRLNSADEFLDDIFDAAMGEPVPVPQSIRQHLDTVFSVKAKGFRELLLVILVAKWLDPDYQPTSDLYACHPRSLYEGPIRDKLTNCRIPRGKSGPLNIAKAGQALNEGWAARRRPPEAGMALVKLAEYVETSSPNEVRSLAIEVARRFLSLAQEVADLYLAVDPRSDLAYLLDLTIDLLTQAPASGNTAQRIVGLILEVQRGSEDVQGTRDAASTTNTTSKKAGDLTIWTSSGSPRVIEVTQKRFDAQRMEDSYESVRAMDEASGTKTATVVVLCRPEDVPDQAENLAVAETAKASSYLGTASLHDLSFEFVDLYQWVASQFATMTDSERADFHGLLADYVEDPNTAVVVKHVWADHHGGENQPDE